MIPLFVICIMLVVYGLIQPYKSKSANVLELVIQINFIILLAVGSNTFIKDTYNTFPVPQMPTRAYQPNTTEAVCEDTHSNHGISDISKILLPLYYFPLLLLMVTAVGKLILYVYSR